MKMGNFTNTCKELFLDDITRIYPLRAGILIHAQPETLRTTHVDVTQLSRTEGGATTAFGSLQQLSEWLAGHEHFTEEPETLMGLELSDAATLRIATESAAGGYRYTLTLTLPTTYYHEEERVFIRQLERLGHDYILERRDGTLALLRYFSPAQKVTHNADGGSATITVSMKNVTGMQDIVADESDE